MTIPRSIIDEYNRIQDRIKAGKKKPIVVPCPTCKSSMVFNLKGVKYTFIPSPEEDIDYRKQFADDPELVSKIEKALDEGDEWAWCSVECRTEWRGFTGSAYLGGCSLYDGEKDFIRCWGKDMKAEALENLVSEILKVEPDYGEQENLSAIVSAMEVADIPDELTGPWDTAIAAAKKTIRKSNRKK